MAFGDWLGAIGWFKFLLLALLALAIGGIVSSAMVRREPMLEITPDETPVDVRVVINRDGIRIAPPGVPAPPKAPAMPMPPAPPDPPGHGGPGAEAGKALPQAKGQVRVDKDGVRIVGSDNGRPVEVVINQHGIRIDRADKAAGAGVADAAGPGAAEGKGEPTDRTDASSAAAAPSIDIPADVMDDPDKVEAAVEAARSQIESIVRDQVDRRVARVRHTYQEEKSDWLMSLLMLTILALVIVKVVLGSKRKAETQARRASATAAEEGLKRQLAEAQLKMMQAQVEPHFLFNTLASVDYLIETDPARASKMQKNLIQYLRASLPQMREGSTTLGKEIALCRSYLEILKVRMEDRLQVALIVPQGLQSAVFPPMMLQSLVENAIKHGLEPKPEGGSLTLSADIANGNLRVTVADTGLGFGAAGRSGTGVGLSNVRERLAALYGGSARLAVEANSPSGTIVTIEVPYAIDPNAAADARRGDGPAAAAGGIAAQPA